MQDEAGAPLIPATPAQHDPLDPADPTHPDSTYTDSTHTDSTHTDSTLTPAATPAGPTPARRRRLFLLLAGIAVVTYLLDQFTKWGAVRALTDAEPRNLLGSFLRLELIRNPGAAFSIGTGNTWVLTIIAVVVLVVVVRVSRRLGSSGWAWALGLLLGGALGNLTDRIVREPGLGRGHVVDFLNYNGWFIGNVADIAIVGAAVLIGLLALTGRGVDGTRETRESGRHEATEHDV
ncbi:MAG TPA: signal peptidase II [Lapillicoccus sp.]